MKRMSLWLIILEWRVKRREEKWMLMYAETLGEFNLFVGILVNSSQLGWCTVPIRSLSLLFNVLETL